MVTARYGGVPNAVKFTPERVRGAANGNWKGGITPERERLRCSAEAIAWRNAVLQRDHFTCQLCGQVGYEICAHHKKSWAEYPALRYDVNNGVTLCKTCHKERAHNGAFRNPPIDWEILQSEKK